MDGPPGRQLQFALQRSDAIAAFVFLDVNGFDLTASATALEQVVLDVAGGEISKGETLIWMEKHTSLRK